MLAGATGESSRLPSQRKADAAKRLRYASYTPLASYSGRAKNKVMERVNTQSNKTENDLLAGILENQSIAFSSSKKLVLTNNRKLTKQTDTSFSYDIIQKSSIMSEPLPSQKQTSENCNADTNNTSENTNSHPSDVLKEDKMPDESHPNSSLEGGSERQRSPSSSLHHSSSNSRDDQRKSKYDSHRSSHRHDDRTRDENGHHSRKRESAHQYSKYSPNNRHSRWGKNSSPHEPSHSSYRSNDRCHSSYRRDKFRDHRDYNSRHDSHRHGHSRERSSCNRNRSPVKDGKQDRWGSSSHERSRDRKSHSSHLYKSHSKSRRESTHSLNRSHWSYDYFNCNDNVISKNNANSVFASSNMNDQRKVNSESSGNISSDLLSSSSLSSVSIAKTLSGNDEVHLRKELNENSKSQSCNDGSSSITTNSQFQKQVPNIGMNLKVDKSESSLNDGRELVDQTESGDDILNLSCKETVVENHPLSSDALQQSCLIEDHLGCVSGDSSVAKDISDRPDKNLLLSSGKKAKMSALFGDSENEDKTLKRTGQSIGSDHWKKREEKDKRFSEVPKTSTVKVPKTSKSKMLFGHDTDGTSDSENEVPEYRPEQSASQDKDVYEMYTPSNPSHLSSDTLRNQFEEYSPIIQRGSLTSIKIKVPLESQREIRLYGKNKDGKSIDLSDGNDLKGENMNLHQKFRLKEHKTKDIDDVEDKSVVGQRSSQADFEEHYKSKDEELEDNNNECGEGEVGNSTKYGEVKLDKRHESRKESLSHRKHQNLKEATAMHSESCSKNEMDSIGGRKSKERERKSDVKLSTKEKESSCLENGKHNNKRREAGNVHAEKQHLERKKVETLPGQYTNKDKESDSHEKDHRKEKEMQHDKSKNENDPKSLKHDLKETEIKTTESDKKPKASKNIQENIEKEKGSHSVSDNLTKNHQKSENKKSSLKEEKPNVETLFKSNNSKNNGVGKKSSRDMLFGDEKNKNLNQSSRIKDFGNKEEKSKNLKYVKHKERKSEDNYGIKSQIKGDCIQGRIPKNNSLTDLFGDIDDIESSSSSNLPEAENKILSKYGVESEHIKDFEPEERPVSFKFMNCEANQKDTTNDEEINTSQLMLDEGLDIHREALSIG